MPCDAVARCSRWGWFFGFHYACVGPTLVPALVTSVAQGFQLLGQKEGKNGGEGSFAGCFFGLKVVVLHGLHMFRWF